MYYYAAAATAVVVVYHVCLNTILYAVLKTCSLDVIVYLRNNQGVVIMRGVYIFHVCFRSMCNDRWLISKALFSTASSRVRFAYFGIFARF